MKLLKILLLVLPPWIIIALVYFLPRAININTIECESQYGPCNTVLARRIDEIQSGKLREAKSDLKAILSDNVFVKEYSSQFEYPDKIRVFLVEEKPVYALRKDNEENFLVSSEGYVLTRSSSTNLPTISAESSFPSVGEKVSTDAHFALEIIYDVYPLYQVERSTMDSKGLHVFISEGLEIIFPLEGDRQILLGSLNLILSQLRGGKEDPKIEEVSDVEIIDLRFKNPVLILSNRS